MSNYKEIWKPIRGYEGRYKVSNMGRVRSLIKRIKKGQRVKKRYIVKPSIGSRAYKTKKGIVMRPDYIRVHLHKNGTRYFPRVHKLVAEAFLGPRPEGMCTDHINADMYDNRACNLRYLTNSENVRRGFAEKPSKRSHWLYTISTPLLSISYDTYSMHDVARHVNVARNTMRNRFKKSNTVVMNGCTIARRMV